MGCPPDPNCDGTNYSSRTDLDGLWSARGHEAHQSRRAVAGFDCDDSPQPTRRTLLGTLTTGGLAGVAGCGLWEGRGGSPPPSISHCHQSVDLAEHQPDGLGWPQPRRDAANTGVAHTPAPTAPVETGWTLSEENLEGAIERGGAFKLAPTVRDGTVVLSASSAVHGIDATDGALQWSVDLTTMHAIEWPTILTDDLIVAADGDSADDENPALVGLDWSDQTERWRRDLELPRGPWSRRPTHDDATLYVQTRKNELVALDVATGETRWGPVAPAGPIRGSPAVVGDRVFVEGEDRVFALDTESGNLLWERPLDLSPTERGSYYLEGVAVADAERVYVRRTFDWDRIAVDGGTGADRAFDGFATLFALDQADGSTQWTAHFPASERVAQPVVRDGVVFVDGSPSRALLDESKEKDGQPEPFVVAIDAANGCERWRVHPFDDPFAFHHPGMALADDTLVVTRHPEPPERRAIQGLATADGSVRWEYPLSEESGHLAEPVVADGTLYQVWDAGGGYKLAAIE
ncbi:MAG: PQQ-binding-like beta-propeller repeat protein [Halobacteriaceae archaeon]